MIRCEYIPIELSPVEAQVTLMSLLVCYKYKTKMIIHNRGKQYITITSGFLEDEMVKRKLRSGDLSEIVLHSITGETGIDPIEFGYFCCNKYLSFGNDMTYDVNNKNDLRALNVFYIIAITGQPPEMPEGAKKSTFTIPYVQLDNLGRLIKEQLNCQCGWLVEIFQQYLKQYDLVPFKKRNNSDIDKSFSITYEGIDQIIQNAQRYTTSPTPNTVIGNQIKTLNDIFNKHCERVCDKFSRGEYDKK